MAVVRVVVEIDYCDRCHAHTDPRDIVGNALYDALSDDDSLDYKVLDGTPNSEREA